MLVFILIISFVVKWLEESLYIPILNLYYFKILV